MQKMVRLLGAVTSNKNIAVYPEKVDKDVKINQLGNESGPLVMGILNVTPDSFSDGGMWNTVEKAVAHAIEMQKQGADIIDIGGESTRPGADRVSVAEEKQRVLPVIEEYLRRVKNPLPISIDTVNQETAEAAIATGAKIVNDISGGQFDSRMYGFIADSGVPYICQHIVGTPQNMDNKTNYQPDVVQAVKEFFRRRLEIMSKAGIDKAQIVLDPGLGFAKTANQCWQLLGGIEELKKLGYPILLGPSRKRFTQLATIKDRSSGLLATDILDEITAVISVLAANIGVWAVRVHNVEKTANALAVVKKWRENVSS